MSLRGTGKDIVDQPLYRFFGLVEPLPGLNEVQHPRGLCWRCGRWEFMIIL